ncbi:hypothetical protein COEREDRAFT_91075 [Coemansia reversa NRRL 1564]|uniref:Uncharacterized protein n=1 Tax=Coemansia reversa (strain ATCC 12441 / NRRL 1564) TaxID=763665 RepID=A0A2G5BI74_COERN|nr:hypothetical protein COEREDRAFT_91075 [Coemansia reversa NRRL 1564]|eukprot:PIA18693.1 hypothetical protein COEREDRAFT_91075 [Coemansia reversa NRRL 1564]
MPRRRYRRIEWSDAMASHETLVEINVVSDVVSARPTTVASPAAAANTRPSQIRNNSTLSNNDATHSVSAAAAAAVVTQRAPVARSDSEQTNSAVPMSSESKTHSEFARRLRESIARRLRSVSAHIMQTHLSGSSRGMNSYYAVAIP